MTKLDPEKLQLPPTFLLSVHSLPQIRRAFFSDSFFSFQIVSMLYSLTPTTSLPTFSSQPSFLMRRKLAGLSNPHASSPNQLHGESPAARIPPDCSPWWEMGNYSSLAASVAPAVYRRRCVRPWSGLQRGWDCGFALADYTEMKSRPGHKIHFRVCGWRETQQWSDRVKGQYVSAAKACFDL